MKSLLILLALTALCLAPLAHADQQAFVPVGKPVEITVTVGGGTAPFTYQWQKDGADIPGATADRLSIASVKPEDAGHYTVRVGNAAGAILSDRASVYIVVAPLTATVGVSQPQSPPPAPPGA